MKPLLCTIPSALKKKTQGLVMHNASVFNAYYQTTVCKLVCESRE